MLSQNSVCFFAIYLNPTAIRISKRNIQPNIYFLRYKLLPTNIDLGGVRLLIYVAQVKHFYLIHFSAKILFSKWVSV